MRKIAVIGAGTMGNGIAHVFALHNYKVQLIDQNEGLLSVAIEKITNNLDRQVKKNEISEIQKAETLQNIAIFLSLDSIDSETFLAIEVVTEKEEIKKIVLSKIASLIPKDSFICSNTSSISITKLANYVTNPERFIGMHFMNPVPVMPLVEVIAGYKTSKQTIDSIYQITETLNKIPLLSQDFPGFVANRILMPMINEAIITLNEGVAGVKEIDGIMKLGMSHPMGPLQLADFIGLDVCLMIMRVLFDGLGKDKYAPSPLLVNMVNAGELGVKSGRGFYDYKDGIKNAIVAKQFNR